MRDGEELFLLLHRVQNTLRMMRSSQQVLNVYN